MSTRDRDRLIRRIGEIDGAATAADVPDMTGEDAAASLRVRLDATRGLVAAEVLRIDSLRRPAAFEAALREAFDAADTARLMASLERADAAQAWRAEADRIIRGAAPATVPARPDVSYAAFRAGRLAPQPDRPAAPPPRHSENGFLTLARARNLTLATVEVDAEWLAGARPDHLAAAIVQAAALDLEEVAPR